MNLSTRAAVTPMLGTALTHHDSPGKFSTPSMASVRGAGHFRRISNAVMMASTMGRSFRSGSRTPSMMGLHPPTWKPPARRWRMAIAAVRFLFRAKLAVRRNAKLTTNDVLAIKKFFDNQGDVLRTSDEIAEALQCMGQAVTSDEAEVMLRRVKHQRGKVLQLRQLIKIMQYLKIRRAQEAVSDTEEAFASLGGTGDGAVDAERLRDVVRDFHLTIDINKMIAEADSNNSGQLDLYEFAQMFDDTEVDTELFSDSTRSTSMKSTRTTEFGSTKFMKPHSHHDRRQTLAPTDPVDEEVDFELLTHELMAKCAKIALPAASPLLEPPPAAKMAGRNAPPVVEPKCFVKQKLFPKRHGKGPWRLDEVEEVIAQTTAKQAAVPPRHIKSRSLAFCNPGKLLPSGGAMMPEDYDAVGFPLHKPAYARDRGDSRASSSMSAQHPKRGQDCSGSRTQSTSFVSASATDELELLTRQRVSQQIRAQSAQPRMHLPVAQPNTKEVVSRRPMSNYARRLKSRIPSKSLNSFCQTPSFLLPQQERRQVMSKYTTLGGIVPDGGSRGHSATVSPQVAEMARNVLALLPRFHQLADGNSRAATPQHHGLTPPKGSLAPRPRSSGSQQSFGAGVGVLRGTPPSASNAHLRPPSAPAASQPATALPSVALQR